MRPSRWLETLLICELLLPAGARAQVASVEVVPAGATLIAGNRLPFKAIVRDAAGRPVTTARVTWSAGPIDRAAIDSTGLLSTYRQGQVRVVAVAGGKTGSGVVQVEPKSPASIDLVPDQAEIVVGGSTVLGAVARTEDEEPLQGAVFAFRSSDERVATVDPVGVVTGLGEGTAILVATAGQARGEVRITVVTNRIAHLSVTGPVLGHTGDVVRLRPIGEDRRMLPVPNPAVRWAVSGRGASIGPDGGFVAESPGVYLVTASAGAVAATHAIRVSRRLRTRILEPAGHTPLGEQQATEVGVVGDVAYLSTLGGRLYTFDVRDPASPAKADSLVLGTRRIGGISTTADGKIGVVAREGGIGGKGGLVFLDLAQPLHPRVLSEYAEALSEGARSAVISGQYVYVADQATGSLRVIGIADPQHPREVGGYAVSQADARTLEIGGQAVSAGRQLHSVQVRDGFAYLAYGRHGLVILDVGNGLKGGSPERPRLVSRFAYNLADYYPPELSAGTHSAFRFRNYVFVADQAMPPAADFSSRARIPALGRIHVLDVTDISRPVKVAEYQVQDAGCQELWVEDDVLYAGCGEGGLRAVDVSGELRGDLLAQGREIGAVWTGAPTGYRPNLPMAWGVQFHKGYVYASDVNGGFWVARVTPVSTP